MSERIERVIERSAKRHSFSQPAGVGGRQG
jgi:hypothetical protein